MAQRWAIDAPAKLNLTLHVAGRRSDGYHELRSLVCGVTLADRLVASPAAMNATTVACNHASIPLETNLAYLAVQRLRAKTGCREGLHLELTKRIPLGGGMGGGSSDAAASLLLARRAWDLHLTDEQLAEVGAEVGSDVPLFFYMPSAVITGRGEQAASVRMNWSGWFVLVHGGVNVSTADVYRRWSQSGSGQLQPDRTDEALRATSARELCACLHNDLTEAVFAVAPAVQSLHAAITQSFRNRGFGEKPSLPHGRGSVVQQRPTTAAPPPFHLTGAGSTFFAPLDTEAEAGELARRIGDAKLKARVEVVRFLPSALVVEPQT
ncbi:MAG: 4-(cytidine 5'-diphospho)-2-C-methyl-D-erythritol kinase [Phycisphaerales bacterium]|nr:4-(cytidine 5'-diphospho)-2-C-methyl-D-erythritol kinase [Phycisphaerales bacterium]